VLTVNKFLNTKKKQQKTLYLERK